MADKKYPHLERHMYAPELNTLHISPTESIKVGFFDIIYSPTLEQAIAYAKRKNLYS
jgi:hypothetical protein